jgi:peptidoglycan/xylan/chitin deacetylase (PgdA/CDA1 family)
MGFRRRLRLVVSRVWRPKPKPLILGYHRVANEPTDHWQLTVSPARFEEQLEVLRRSRYPLSLADFIRKLVAGTLPADAVALTFDDGYVDNLLAAKPLLAKAGVPATVFLATGFLDRPGEFWWDELARIILHGKGPSDFELMISGKPRRFTLYAAAHPRRRRAAPSSRRETLRAIWQILRRLGDEERGLAMQSLRSTFIADGQAGCCSRAMTRNEVRTLIDDGSITVGAHTVTHPLLVGLEASACRREIRDSKATCEELAGASVPSFAYPFGGVDTAAREEVKSAGFAFACSTQYGPALPTSDLFVLPRVNIQNWDGNTFERALRFAGVPV